MYRVLMIAPTPFFSDRGCHVRIYEEARALLNAGCDVRVITYPVGDDPPGIDIVRISKLFKYEKITPGPSWQKLVLDLQLLLKTFSQIKKYNPDIIHAHLHEGAMIAALSMAHKPVVFDYQGSLTGESVQHGFIEDQGIVSMFFNKAEKLIEGSADVIVTSVGHLSNEISSKNNDIVTVPDAVDFTRFRPARPDPDLKKALKIPEGPVLCIYLGVMSDYQGIDVLLESVKVLSEKNVDIHFLIMGYPEEEYVKKADALGVSDMVTFTGRVDYFKAADYIRLGDVCVAPKLSRTESNGKLLTYMACGLPVVAFDISVNREIIGDGAIWSQTYEDRVKCSESLAEAIEYFTENRAQASEIALKGRSRIKEDMSTDMQAQRLLAVYADILHAKNGGFRSEAAKFRRIFYHQFERAIFAADSFFYKALKKTYGDELSKEAHHWSEKNSSKIFTWQDHPSVQAYVNTRVSGRPEQNWVDWFLKEYGKDGFDRALNLGCGFGDLEDHVLSAGGAFNFVSADISKDAVSHAQKRLFGHPVKFLNIDINKIELLENTFDVVFASSSIHHFVELEHIFDEIYKSLKPGGYFVFNEYVGPSKFRWKSKQLDIVNLLLQHLPKSYRKDLRRSFIYKSRVYRPPLDGTDRNSPFEAVRSDEIVKNAECRFNVVARRDYGGGILHMLLDGISGNFAPSLYPDNNLLDSICKLEMSLENAGEIDSDFTVMVCKKDHGV
jgi:glycosyltransferase involved in cell wall biosynthesis/SAM-dependent methyltransferase